MLERVIVALSGELYGDERAWERAARAAIDAMKNPTEEMLDCPGWEEMTMGEIWNEMIEIALTDKHEPAPQEGSAVTALRKRGD